MTTKFEDLAHRYKILCEQRQIFEAELTSNLSFYRDNVFLVKEEMACCKQCFEDHRGYSTLRIELPTVK